MAWGTNNSFICMYTCIYTAKGKENCPTQGKEAHHPNSRKASQFSGEGGSQERKTGQVCLLLSLILDSLCLLLKHF